MSASRVLSDDRAAEGMACRRSGDAVRRADPDPSAHRRQARRSSWLCGGVSCFGTRRPTSPAMFGSCQQSRNKAKEDLVRPLSRRCARAIGCAASHPGQRFRLQRGRHGTLCLASPCSRRGLTSHAVLADWTHARFETDGPHAAEPRRHQQGPRRAHARPRHRWRARHLRQVTNTSRRKSTQPKRWRRRSSASSTRPPNVVVRTAGALGRVRRALSSEQWRTIEKVLPPHIDRARVRSELERVLRLRAGLPPEQQRTLRKLQR